MGGRSLTSHEQRRNQASAVGSMGCSNFHLFGLHLDGKRFARDSDVKRNIISRPHTLDKQFWNASLQTWKPRLDKRLNIKEMNLCKYRCGNLNSNIDNICHKRLLTTQYSNLACH